MDSSSYFNWTSKARLQEFRAKLNSNSVIEKKTELDEYKKGIFSSFRTTPISGKNRKKSRGGSGDFAFCDSPKSNIYSSLSNFKSRTNGKYEPPEKSYQIITRSPKVMNKEIQIPRPFYKKEAEGFKDPENKNLVDLITIGTLSKATRIAASEEINQLPRAYLRQLKQFCNEALSNLNN